MKLFKRKATKETEEVNYTKPSIDEQIDEKVRQRNKLDQEIEDLQRQKAEEESKGDIDARIQEKVDEVQALLKEKAQAEGLSGVVIVPSAETIQAFSRGLDFASGGKVGTVEVTLS